MHDLRRDGREDAATTVVLAHGAGEPLDSPLLEAIAHGLANEGFAVVRFEFPYMAERRATGRRRPPDPLPRLVAAYREVLEQIGDARSLVLGGRSLGGRVASLIADDVAARALLVLSYPFHPPRRPEVLRTGHLGSLRTKALIVHGERDPFGTPEEVAGYRLAPSIELCWIPDGDHGLAPRRRSGRTLADNVALALTASVRFLSAIR